jgi:hypothetical protein
MTKNNKNHAVKITAALNVAKTERLGRKMDIPLSSRHQKKVSSSALAIVVGIPGACQGKDLTKL